MENKNDYFGLSKVVSFILAFLVGPILGIIVRFMEGKIVPAIVRLVLVLTVVLSWIPWILDMIWIIKDGKICDLGNII